MVRRQLRGKGAGERGKKMRKDGEAKGETVFVGLGPFSTAHLMRTRMHACVRFLALL